MSATLAGTDVWGGAWGLLALATMATFVWRALGTIIAARINPDGALFEWVACVAYALLAGLVARIIVMPVGMLAESATVDRIGATAFGFALFFLTKRNVAFGTIGGAFCFLVLAWARDAGIL